MLRKGVLGVGLLCGSALLTCSPAQAQVEKGIELRGGVNVPVGDFAETPGFAAESMGGFGVNLILPVHRRIGVYFGGGRDIFDCTRCRGGEEVRTTGLEGGVKALLPMGPLSWTPWFRVGAAYHQVEFEIDGSDGKSDWNMGFQLAVGLDIPMGDVLAFSPNLRYHSHNATFDPQLPEFLEKKEDVRFLSFGLGMVIHLGRD